MKPSTSLGSTSNVGMVNSSPSVRQTGNIRGLLLLSAVCRNNVPRGSSDVKERCRCRVIVRTALDAIAALLKRVGLAGADHPFANPVALIRPHGDAHLRVPVIEDFQEPTGFIPV